MCHILYIIILNLKKEVINFIARNIKAKIKKLNNNDPSNIIRINFSEMSRNEQGESSSDLVETH